MPRSVRFIPVVAAAAVLAAAGAHAALSGQQTVSAHHAVSSTLHAFVHDDESIGLTYDDGSPVGNQSRVPPTIPPGTYTVKVIDDTTQHNFHLTGPGVEQSTGIGDMASPTWTVTFQAGGQYEFLCDEHPDFMYGYFNGAGASSGGSSSGGSSGGSSSGGTSSGGTSSGGSTSSGGKTSSGGTTSTLLGTLIGRVNPAGKLTLTYGGIPVTKVKAGRYKITVADKSPKRSFLVQRIGSAATTVTSVAYVGTHSVTVNFLAGKWDFFTSAGPASKTPFTVTP
jgi:plastocyanin